MKNLFKKILACCLVVCMVFTLCISAVTVSAEEATIDGALTIGNAEVAAGAKEATVSFTALAEKDGIAAAEVNVTLPAGATGISKVELVTEDDNVQVTFGVSEGKPLVELPGENPEDPDGADVYVYEGDVNIIDNVFSYILWVNNNADVTKVATTVEITFVGDFNETAPVTAAIEACKDDVDLLNLQVVKGAINVATHTCTPAEAVQEKVVAATCYAEGSYDEVVYCSECGEEISRTPKTIDKIAHTPAEAVVENEVAATCYAKGSYESVVYCSVEACKFEISRTPVTVDETEHTPATAVVENNVDATCYAEGSYDSVVYCSVAECKHEISRTPVTVEKIAHTPAEAVEENRVEAKPGVAGSYDSVVYCAVEACKAEISRTPVEIPALPVEPTCDHANKTLVEATPASSEKPGLLDYDCPDCDDDDSIDITVTYNAYSVMQTPDIECTATTNLIFKTSSGLFPYIGNGDVTEGIVVIVHTYADGTTKSTVFTLGDATVDGKTYKWFVGVPGKMMADSYAATLYTKAGDTWYSAASIDASVKNSAMAVVRGTGTDKVKKLVANLLVMGAKSQIRFKYNYGGDASKLADAELLANPEYSKYITTTKPSIEMTDENCINKPDATKVFHQTPDIMMEDAVMFRYKMLTNFYADADKLTDMRLELSYEQADGSIKTEVVTDINLEAGSTTKYIASYGVPARYMRKPVSATLYNGDTVVAPTVVFSIECLLSTLTSEDDVNLAIAIMNYSDAAEANFSK